MIKKLINISKAKVIFISQRIEKFPKIFIVFMRSKQRVFFFKIVNIFISDSTDISGVTVSSINVLSFKIEQLKILMQQKEIMKAEYFILG